jgi:hypothetical protein
MTSLTVMPGLDPAIHVFLGLAVKNVDGRDKPGHDEKERHFPTHFGARFSENAFGPSI